MKNIFKMLIYLAMIIISVSTVKAVGEPDWVAIPVEVSLRNRLDNIVLFKYCGRQLECSADMKFVDNSISDVVRVRIRAIRELSAVNPANWHTHEVILFYDQSISDLPDFMKIRKNSWDLPKVFSDVSTDLKEFSLTCHLDGGEDVVMRGSIGFSYNYFENEGWKQSNMFPGGLTAPRPFTPPSVSQPKL